VSTARLSAADLAALRENLHEQLLFRREQLARLAEPVSARSEGRLRRQDAGQLEVGVRLAASARMVLADVEAALRRMDDGSYGICRTCGDAMDREWLLVVPQARACAGCLRARERRR
jgi:RNA polymerase-binding transcription factor DksA